MCSNTHSITKRSSVEKKGGIFSTFLLPIQRPSLFPTSINQRCMVKTGGKFPRTKVVSWLWVGGRWWQSCEIISIGLHDDRSVKSWEIYRCWQRMWRSLRGREWGNPLKWWPAAAVAAFALWWGCHGWKVPVDKCETKIISAGVFFVAISVHTFRYGNIKRWQ